GASTDGQPAVLAMELASSAEAVHTGLRAIKSMIPDYVNLSFAQAPRKMWELLFPLPYLGELTAAASARALDPYLVAGLVRQESEFDPAAISRARAYGLAQVRPATGRLYAGPAGIKQFSIRSLFRPSVNLRLGAFILRGMLDRQGGNLEQT